MHQQQKHENQMREMIGQCESNIRELQQLQVNRFLITLTFSVSSYFVCSSQIKADAVC